MNDDVLMQMMIYQINHGTGSSEEFLVRGAELGCSLGSKHCLLNLPEDHGKYDTGQAVITIKDCKHENIAGFGICAKTGNKCIPNLAEEWITDSATINMFDKTYIASLPVPLADASLLCYEEPEGDVKAYSTGQKNNPNELAGKKKYTIIEDIIYDITIDDDEMCKLVFTPSRTGYYIVNVETKLTFLLSMEYSGLTTYVEIDKYVNEHPNYNFSRLVALRADKKYSLDCYQSPGGFKLSVKGNVDSFTCSSNTLARLWSGNYPEPLPSKIFYISSAPEDPDEWVYKIVYIPKSQFLDFLAVWRDVKSWIYNQTKKKETEDNTWWDDFWQGKGSFDVQDLATGLIGYAISEGIIALLVSAGVAVSSGAAAIVAAIGIAGGYLATYLMNSLGSKVDFNSVMDMLLEEMKMAVGLKDEASREIKSGVKIVTKKKYISFNTDHDLGSYSEHNYITSWDIEAGGIIEAEKYEHGTFGTVNIDQMKQLFNEVCDTSTAEPKKSMTTKEIQALGEKYRSLFPELERQVQDYKAGYICSKVYVNKMEA